MSYWKIYRIAKMIIGRKRMRRLMMTAPFFLHIRPYKQAVDNINRHILVTSVIRDNFTNQRSNASWTIILIQNK